MPAPVYDHLHTIRETTFRKEWELLLESCTGSWEEKIELPHRTDLTQIDVRIEDDGSSNTATVVLTPYSSLSANDHGRRPSEVYNAANACPSNPPRTAEIWGAAALRLTVANNIGKVRVGINCDRGYM